MPTEPSSNYIEKMNTLDKGFNDRLKQVFVTSVNKVNANWNSINTENE